MSNVLHYKFKGNGKIYSSTTACITHLYDPHRWSFTSLKLNGIDVKRPQYEDIEWVEYRVRSDHDDGVWLDLYKYILKNSRIAEYLIFRTNGEVAHRFNLSSPRSRTIFIISLMRYPEEHSEYVKRALHAFKYEGRFDEFLAYLSQLIGPFDAHTVFNPSGALKGLFSYLDEFFHEMFRWGIPMRGRESEIPRDRVSNKWGPCTIYESPREIREILRLWEAAA